MISTVRQFHDGMRACVRLDNRVCSGWFAVEQGLHQEGCVLAPLLFNIVAAVINVASTRFKADKHIMHVVVCAVFGLTVSEDTTEIMCLRTKRIPESIATNSVEAAGQVYKQTNEFVYLWGNVNHNADLCIEINRWIRNAWRSFRKYTLKLYVQPIAPLELKIRMLRAEVETMLHG